MKTLKVTLKENERQYIEGILEREIGSLERDIESKSIQEKLESVEQVEIDFIKEILTKLVRKIK